MSESNDQGVPVVFQAGSKGIQEFGPLPLFARVKASRWYISWAYRSGLIDKLLHDQWAGLIENRGALALARAA